MREISTVIPGVKEMVGRQHFATSSLIPHPHEVGITSEVADFGPRE
jgi:hypothetical protein